MRSVSEALREDGNLNLALFEDLQLADFPVTIVLTVGSGMPAVRRASLEALFAALTVPVGDIFSPRTGTAMGFRQDLVDEVEVTLENGRGLRLGAFLAAFFKGDRAVAVSSPDPRFTSAYAAIVDRICRRWESLTGQTDSVDVALRIATERLIGSLRQDVLDRDELIAFLRAKLHEANQTIDQLEAAEKALQAELRRAKLDGGRVGLVVTLVVGLLGGVASGVGQAWATPDQPVPYQAQIERCLDLANEALTVAGTEG